MERTLKEAEDTIKKAQINEQKREAKFNEIVEWALKYAPVIHNTKED